ncbi:DUF2817 domain-containing protein [Christiangramia sp. OXR-203]|jgi:hypothetical protein|uniref:DUF2817 domain-containing protein n=1 Tax=Christiangramia sp. OXR-203 TaxID=3100176 RepID=UPI002AC8A091|nr:DUF2817 domain-containing protein [Christiangramia sp. OXR-203]WPY97247.1 DUF2817 domain-containing protein [Christiangramia sp. OXR-203]
MKEKARLWLSNRDYDKAKFRKVAGRYFHNNQLEDFISMHSDRFEFETIGTSVEHRNIYGLQIGSGSKKVLMWSQMHGNESTTTKAVLDFLNSIAEDVENLYNKSLLEETKLYIIPVLNPDGAANYTRVNANNVDLNRDMQDLSQPESRLLMKVYREFQPDFCLNLHDQRTIFSAGETNLPAILSFLTPSSDIDRSITGARKDSMSLIAGIVKDLKDELGERIGRYDDGFNINCAGDTFQSLGTPTILFEAGHYPGDYNRDVTRKFIFKALRSCLEQIMNGQSADHRQYLKIPENAKCFRDVILRNVNIEGDQKDILIQFKETLVHDRIRFVPVIEGIHKDSVLFGHREIDAACKKISLMEEGEISENVVVNKIFLNDEIFELNPQ